MPTLSADRLRQLAVQVFQHVDAPAEHAEIVSDHLVEANLVGMDSHGIIRVPQYVRIIREGKLKPAAMPTIVRETATSATIEGNSAFGQVAATTAMRLAMRKAHESAISVVGLAHCAHTGRLGHYTSMAAAENLIGIMMVNAGGAGQWVAPFGGSDRRLATNPISIGVPTGLADPFLMDMATSVAAEGKIRSTLHKGGTLPEGWIQDHKGNATTNPKDLYEPELGSIHPIGGSVGYKGYALSMMVDLLAGGLTGAGCARADVPEPTAYSEDGALFIAIDVDALAPLQDFFARAQGQSAHVKESPPAPGFKEVLVPGELEARSKAARVRDGIPVPDETWRQLAEVAETLGITAEEFI